MATRRSTFGKQDRERAKKAKAAAKRERRFDRSEDDKPDDRPAAGDYTADELLRAIEALHQDFDANRISFEEFEERKLELFEQLAAIELP